MTRDERVVLRDGSEVVVRQVRSSDEPLLADGFGRLSAESRRLRFLTDKVRLTPAELHYFTSVDHHDHEALGVLDPADGSGLAVARFIRDPQRPESAEIAITVVDAWQRRGLGTELMRRLSNRAREEGVERFTALVAADNAAVVRLLRDVGAQVEATRREPGTVEYDIRPAPGSVGVELQALLRAFGAGMVRPPRTIRELLVSLIPARFTTGR